MNDRMKRIISMVKNDIKDRAADIEYQKMDAEQKAAAKDLKNLKPKAPRLTNVSNLMVGNE